ncbi:MAG TPA: hypothetical protein VEC06_04010 [Paucimonas sp.]|nr:hypothetical protein [Paucimonas sp.]
MGEPFPEPPGRQLRRRLGPGQALRLQAGRGTTVIALRGAFELAGPPAWLAGHVVSTSIRLREGEAHVLPRGGPITLESLGPGEVLCLGEPERRAPSAAWRAALAAGWRRLCRHSPA